MTRTIPILFALLVGWNAGKYPPAGEQRKQSLVWPNIYILLDAIPLG